MPIAAIPRVTIVSLVVAVGAATVFSACGADSGAEGETIRVAHNSNAAVLPVRVAAEQGYFEDAGLQVEFTEVENIGTLPPALDNSFDIVLTPPTGLIDAQSQGIDIVAAAGATIDVPENPTAGVVTKTDSGIEAFQDLKDKRIGVMTETGTLHIATLSALEKAGVSQDDIRIVQVDGPAHADQLDSGQIDAVETLAPFRGQLLASGDTVDIGDPYLELAPELSALLWGTSSSWADENAEDLKAFREAIDQAIDFIESNEEDARTALQDYTGMPEDVVETTTLPNYISELRPQDLEVWHNAMRTVGGFEGDLDLDALMPTGQ